MKNFIDDAATLESLAARTLAAHPHEEAVNVIGLECIKNRNLLRALIRFYIDTYPNLELRREGQTDYDVHLTDARPSQPDDDGGGHRRGVPQSGFAPSVVALPKPARGHSAIASIQGIMGKYIVFRLRDGRDIMDAQFHELAKIEKAGLRNATGYMREAIVARYLREHVTYANPDPFARIGDLFPQKMLELAISEAEKETVHG